MAAVFISYRRDDSAGYAGRLHEELEERLGAGQVFRDVDTLQPGQDFVDAIGERLRECQVCLVLIGRGWLSALDESGRRRLDQHDDYVSLEIAAALARPGVLVVPVLTGGGTMPAAADLPQPIQALARRQALTLRDDSWEHDVDRLAATLAQHVGHAPAQGGRPHPENKGGVTTGPRRKALAVAAAAAVLGAAWFFWPHGEPGRADGAPPELESSAPAAREESAGPAQAIEIPNTPEIAHGDLIYTVVAASLRTGRPTSTLWLRVRASNEGGVDANLWDQSFRVAIGGDVVAASGGLNEILGGHSIRQAVVRFEIPSGFQTAVLQVTDGRHTGELPLGLAPTGAPPKHDEPDPGDALSRASIRALVREPAPLVSSGDLRATLTRASARRFANMIRVSVSVRLENRGGIARASGDVVLRLTSGGEVLAPERITIDVVESHATLDADARFDLPPTANAVVLRGSVGSASGDVALTVR